MVFWFRNKLLLLFSWYFPSRKTNVKVEPYFCRLGKTSSNIATKLMPFSYSALTVQDEGFHKYILYLQRFYQIAFLILGLFYAFCLCLPCPYIKLCFALFLYWIVFFCFTISFWLSHALIFLAVSRFSNIWMCGVTDSYIKLLRNTNKSLSTD